MKPLACCFTGHRELPFGAELKRIEYSVDALIATAYLGGIRSFFVGGAMGFDTLAAERVLLFRKTHSDIRLVMLVPYANQGENYSGEARRRYLNTRAAADEVYVLEQDYNIGCYYRRNAELVRNADLCIAYLRKATGGTANTVALARKKGIKVEFIPLS